MPKGKVPERKMKLREFDVKYAINGSTKAQIIEFLSGLEVPEEATLYLSASEYYGSFEATAAFEYFTEETDEEYQARIRQESLREALERHNYELLKKKFEGGSK